MSLNYLPRLFPHRLPGTVYHYTSHPALKGIVENGELWATNIRYLNDANELNWALCILRYTLGVFGGRLRYPWQHAVFRLLTEEWLDRISEQSEISVFTCSFSEDADDLSQWRGYCPPGAGYSIGFDAASLRAIGFRKGFAFGKCEYTRPQQEEAVGELVQWGLGMATGVPPHPFEQRREADLRQLAEALFGRFLAMGCLLKDSAFEAEHEWRLVGWLGNERFPTIEYREGKTMIVPFVKLGPVPSPKAVVIGPTAHPELAKRSLYQFLVGKELVHVVPKRSRWAHFRQL